MSRLGLLATAVEKRRTEQQFHRGGRQLPYVAGRRAGGRDGGREDETIVLDMHMAQIDRTVVLLLRMQRSELLGYLLEVLYGERQRTVTAERKRIDRIHITAAVG